MLFNSEITMKYILIILFIFSISCKSMDVKVFDITKYGATPNDDKDDTKAILAILNKASAYNKAKILIPKGRFIVNSIFVKNLKNITIEGNGILCKKLDNTAPVLFLDNAENIIINNIKIEGNDIIKKKQPSGYDYNAIQFTNSKNIAVNNVEIYKMTGGGIIFFHSEDISVLDSYFHDNHSLADIAFGYDTAKKKLNNFVAKRNKCYSNNLYGILAMGYGEKIEIEANDIKNKTQYGIIVYSLGNDLVNWSNVSILNNIVENVSDTSPGVNDKTNSYFGMGIYCQTVMKLKIQGNKISDVLKERKEFPFRRTLPPSAISLNSCDDYQIINNEIYNSGVDGISMYNNDREFFAENNIISDNKISGTNAYGIYLLNAANVTLFNNTIENTRDSAIRVFHNNKFSKQVFRNITIQKNEISSITDGSGIELQGQEKNKLSFINIKDNKIRKVDRFSILLVDTENAIITNNDVKQNYYYKGKETPYYMLQVTNSNQIEIDANKFDTDNAKPTIKSLYLDNVKTGKVTNNKINTNEKIRISNSIVVEKNNLKSE